MCWDFSQSNLCASNFLSDFAHLCFALFSNRRWAKQLSIRSSWSQGEGNKNVRNFDCRLPSLGLWCGHGLCFKAGFIPLVSIEITGIPNIIQILMHPNKTAVMLPWFFFWNRRNSLNVIVCLVLPVRSRSLLVFSLCTQGSMLFIFA